MKNVINYYYGFNITNIYQVNGTYYFTYLYNKYILKEFDREPNEIYRLFSLNNILIKNNNYFHKIILTNSNVPYIEVNNKIYVLIKLSNIINDKISIYDITGLKINIVKELSSLVMSDWYNLWIRKIDYLEYKIEHIETNKKIIPIFHFFIGLSENAVSLVKNGSNKSKTSSDDLVINHRRIDINMNIIDYYLPLNLVIDHKTRDIAEYIKSSIVENTFDYNLLDEYLNYANLSEYGYSLLMARVLFPTFFYDNLENFDYLYNFDISKYISYLKDVYYIIKNRSNIDIIDWLEK